jgi:hypothetical protein
LHLLFGVRAVAPLRGVVGQYVLLVCEGFVVGLYFKGVVAITFACLGAKPLQDEALLGVLVLLSEPDGVSLYAGLTPWDVHVPVLGNAMMVRVLRHLVAKWLRFVICIDMVMLGISKTYDLM